MPVVPQGEGGLTARNLLMGDTKAQARNFQLVLLFFCSLTIEELAFFGIFLVDCLMGCSVLYTKI